MYACQYICLLFWNHFKHLNECIYFMLLFDVINQQKKGKINEEFINIFILFQILNILYFLFYNYTSTFKLTKNVYIRAHKSL